MTWLYVPCLPIFLCAFFISIREASITPLPGHVGPYIRRDLVSVWDGVTVRLQDAARWSVSLPGRAVSMGRGWHGPASSEAQGPTWEPGDTIIDEPSFDTLAESFFEDMPTDKWVREEVLSAVVEE